MMLSMELANLNNGGLNVENMTYSVGKTNSKRGFLVIRTILLAGRRPLLIYLAI